MKDLHKLDQYRVPHPIWRQDSCFGSFKVFVSGRAFYLLASVDEISKGDFWEHISVTPKNQKRCPTWDEMCYIKELFFEDEEECIQFHPKKSEYVNKHEYCLHIWRPVNGRLVSLPE